MEADGRRTPPFLPGTVSGSQHAVRFVEDNLRGCGSTTVRPVRGRMGMAEHTESGWTNGALAHPPLLLRRTAPASQYDCCSAISLAPTGLVGGSTPAKSQQINRAHFADR